MRRAARAGRLFFALPRQDETFKDEWKRRAYSFKRIAARRCGRSRHRRAHPLGAGMGAAAIIERV